MKNLLNYKRSHILLTGFLLLCVAVCVILFFFLGGYTAADLYGHWRICKYALEGYNPYPLIGEPALDPAIGAIPAAFSTVPWSCIFGSVFYGGFMPVDWAANYIFIVHFLALLALLAVIYRKFKPTVSGKQLAVLLLLPCTHFSFTYSVHYGNSGGIICYLLIIGLLISKERPIAAGLLLGLAMLKPQIAAIVCLVYLLKKEWKPLLVAAVVVFAGWIASSVMTSTSMLQLLIQTFNSGTAAPSQYLGLLNNLKYLGVDSKIILLLNMGIGAAYVVIFYCYIKKHAPAAFRSPFIFVPACFASIFWIYKNGTDYAILTFASIFFCMLCMTRELPVGDFVGSILSIGYLQMSRCAVYLGVYLFGENLLIRDTIKTADGVILAIIGIYLCKLYVRHSSSDTNLQK